MTTALRVALRPRAPSSSATLYTNVQVLANPSSCLAAFAAADAVFDLSSAARRPQRSRFLPTRDQPFPRELAPV